MIIVYILLAIVVLSLLLLFINFNFILEYNNGAHVFMKVLFIKINLIKLVEWFMNRPQKPQKAKKRNKREAVEEEEKKPAEKKSIRNIWDFIKFIKKLTEKVMGKFFEKIKIKLCYIDISVSSNDASKTALIYGAISTAVFSLNEMLKRFINYEYDPEDITIYPDFTKEKINGKIKIVFTLKPIQALSIALYTIKSLFSKRKEFKNERNPIKTNN